MASVEIAFEPTHLSEEELRYELKLRNITSAGTTRNLTKKLREHMIKESKGIYLKPKFYEDAASAVSHINMKLEEFDISMIGLEELPNNKENINALISRFVHTLLRLERIPVSKNAIVAKDIEKFISKIKNCLEYLMKLKTVKPTPQVSTIIEGLARTEIGPISGASDIMATDYALLSSGNIASGVQAPIVSIPIVNISPPSVTLASRGSLGAYPKTSDYISSNITNTVSSNIPITSPGEYVAGRGRGAHLRNSPEINRSSPRTFNDKLYYANHTYVPPVSTSAHFPSVSANNLNSINCNSSRSTVNASLEQPPPYQHISEGFYNHPKYIPSISVPSSNMNYQQHTMTVPFSGIQPPISGFNHQPNVPQPPPNQFNPMVGLDQPDMYQRPFYNRNPVSGWNLFFSGEPNSRSLYDFLSRIEMLARAEHISELMLRRSAYYLFTGSAMTWYRAFEQNLPTWTDLVNALKNQFVPLDYDRALLREIDKRKQGGTESFGMYLANMEMLYRGIQRTNIPEIVKLDTIMRNMLPYLTEKLMLTDITTIAELSNYCRKIENTQFRMAQMNLPNDHKYLLEPQFAYHTPGNLPKDAVPRLGGQYPRK